jgi:hypothetical protein
MAIMRNDHLQPAQGDEAKLLKQQAQPVVLEA